MNASLTNIESNTQPETPERESVRLGEPAEERESVRLRERVTPEYPEPSPELIADIRRRLAELPPDIARYVDEALRRESIEHVASFLWKAGLLVVMSSELYEYRRTLFPPGAMVDPYTAGPPVLRPAEERESVRPGEREKESSLITDDGQPTIQERGSVRLGERERLRSEGGDQISNTEPRAVNPEASVASNADRLSALQCGNPVSSDNGRVLLNDLRSVLSRYLILPEMAAEALALWVVHTYAFTLRQVTTYIGVVSPEKRCGKTTLLELLGRLANRSLTAANISPSAMFRVIEQTQPTLLIDEADTFLEGRDELAGILNAGYRKGNAYVVRVADAKSRRKSEQEQTHAAEFGEWTNERPDGTRGETDFAQYSCWCPKVMAAIGRLPDTLADRCIVITMQRKISGEKCERMSELNAAEYRRRCAEFVREHSQAIAKARPEPAPGLNDRAADIWEPLLAIADLAGGEWPQLARQAAQKLSAQDDELTLTGYFLKDLRNLMVIANVDRMLCRDIVKQLNPKHDRPWEDLRRGREINEWWLGRLLSELGVHSKTMRVGDALGKGYLLAEIDAAFRRYVPNPDLHTTLPPAEPTGSEAPAMDAEMEKDLVRLMRKLMGPERNDQ